jgi:hypothetical protein
MKHLKTYKIFESTEDLKDILSEINYDILDNPFEIEVRILYDVFYDVLKSEIENIQKSYWFKTNSNQQPLENISEIVLVSLRPSIAEEITYNDIVDYVERSVEYMTSEGYNYLLEPVWKNNPGMIYSLKNIKNLDKKLISFHIKFYK